MRSTCLRHRIHIRPRRYWEPSSQACSEPTMFRTLQEEIVTESSLKRVHIELSGRIMNVKVVKPPSCSPTASTVIFIGRNGRGNWVARQQHCMFGGLFVNRAQAFKYALFENGHHPETIVEVSREIELDIPSVNPQIAGKRRVA